MWKLSIEDDQGQRTVVNLVRDEYSVGRAEDNTIRLTERNISRRHARLVRETNRWFLEDLQSYNGAFVNGVRIGGRQELAHGDLVQLGDYRIELMDEELATREQGHQRMPTDPFMRRDSLMGQPDRFVVLIGPGQGSEFSLEAERTVIGRGEECDLCLNHASVSRVHAEVRKLDGGGYEIVDKGSANGVRINGADLERALLDARDVIELGDVVLKFIPAGEIFRADAEDGVRYSLARISSERLTESSRLDPRIVAAAVSFVLLALVGALVFSRTSPTETALATNEVAEEDAVLREAQSMAKRGDVFGAHELLREVPEDSSLRENPTYRRIEEEWADAMLKTAEAEADPAKKRALLDEVARTPSLDAARRSLAAKALSGLAVPSIDLAELEAAPQAETVRTANSLLEVPSEPSEAEQAEDTEPDPETEPSNEAPSPHTDPTGDEP